MKNYNMSSVVSILISSEMRKECIAYLNQVQKLLLPCVNVLLFDIVNTMERQKVRKKDLGYGGWISG